MKWLKDVLKSKGTWVGIVMSILAVAYTLVMGGTTTQTFTGKDGSVYEAKLVIPAGIMTLIDACDLKVEGQTCPVGFNLDVTLKTKGSGKTDPEPVKAEEPVKVEEPVKAEETAPADDKVLKAADVPAEAAAVDTVKDKPVLPPVKIKENAPSTDK